MKLIKALFSRVTFMVLMAVLEVLIVFSIFRWFREHASWIEGVLHLLSVAIVLGIVKNSRHLSSDMLWILMIMLFPIPGTALYLLLGANLITSRTTIGLVRSQEASKKYYVQDPEVKQELIKQHPEVRGQYHYISADAGFPFYRNTGFDYYPSGEAGYPAILEAMRSAEKFIFLEYFIVEEGQMWNGMLEIMEEKARQGVDVRVLYDDMGSFTTLSFKYARTLEKKGIKCIPFNRINPILGIIMNHRDHRKILVVDGVTAFSGGVNLADEYINVKPRFGYWKDNIIRITGNAVWSYTVLFLTHWNALRKTDEDYTVFRTIQEEKEWDGYIAPYGGTPLSNEITAQNIYMGILNQAADYCYIMTPYLIIDTELINALILAAKHGADVRILTPGIPDKKLVFKITQSYYRQLIEGGVRIFEYTPGFVHSKVFVSDDKCAAVGTINLDYRSLYLHFENGTYLYGAEKVLDVKKDFVEAAESAHEVTLAECKSRPLYEFVMGILRIFAPLM